MEFFLLVDLLLAKKKTSTGYKKFNIILTILILIVIMILIIIYIIIIITFIIIIITITLCWSICPWARRRPTPVGDIKTKVFL